MASPWLPPCVLASRRRRLADAVPVPRNDPLPAPEPAPARLVLGQRGLEGLAGEVRPELVAEDELGVGRLPQQVVARAPLAARADDEVGVVHLGGVEEAPEGLLAAAGV